MNSLKPYLVVALIFILGGGWTWVNRVPVSNAAPPALAPAPHADFPAPPFTLQSTTGEQFDLAALKGKVVLVNFWATWCPPCRAEMPAIDQLYRTNREAGLVVLGINQGEDQAAVQSFAGQFNLSFPILLDPNGAVNARYNVSALPTTFIIDRKGIIHDLVIGPVTREQVQRKIQPLLAEGGD